MGCPYVHPSHSVICFINDFIEQPPLWACQHCGKYGQRRWGGLAHTCTLPPSIAGRNALAKLWAGHHPANRTQGSVWRPDPGAQWANPDPLDMGFGQGLVPSRPSYRI
eukprot:3160665-Amphidinium_carterae.1